MNFLERIKIDLEDKRGDRDKVLVGHKALRELVDDFERLDSFYRATDSASRYSMIEEQLDRTIKSMYLLQDKDAETTMMTIMETLLPLMLRRHKENQRPLSYRQNNQYK